jgi:predicted ester cyclase
LYRSAFPDLRTSIDDMIAEGDSVTSRWTAHGMAPRGLDGYSPDTQAGDDHGAHAGAPG